MRRAVDVPAYSAAYLRWVITLLLMIYLVNYADRIVIGVVGESIKKDLGLTDTQLGLLGGLSFTVLYVLVSFPFGRLVERYSRVKVIAAVICVWSGATALCGTATTYLQLVLCRAAVGIGEAGFVPAVVSLLSDYFPPNRRATAYSLVVLGLPLGGAIGSAVAAWVTGNWGWHAAFFVVGPPGLVLGFLTLSTLREPPRGFSEPGRSTTAETPPIRALLRKLANKSAYWHLAVAAGLTNVVGYGLGLFLFPHLVRNFGLPYAKAGLIVGVVNGLTTAIGMGCGGWISDRLGRLDVRWYGWAPCVSVFAGVPLYIAAFLQSSWELTVLFIIIPATVIPAFTPTIQATAQGLVELRMRGTTAAMSGAITTAIGLGLGTVMTGMASDFFAKRIFASAAPTADYRLQCEAHQAVGDIVQVCAHASGGGMRYALLSGVIFLLWGALHFFLAARTLPRDLEADYGVEPVAMAPNAKAVVTHS